MTSKDIAEILGYTIIYNSNDIDVLNTNLDKPYRVFTIKRKSLFVLVDQAILYLDYGDINLINAILKEIILE